MKSILVVVVDDELYLVEALSALLGGEGYRVIPASSGRAALDVLDKELPDLILLDLMMPELSGFQVLESIQKRPAFKSVPIILMSASKRPTNLPESSYAAFIGKPFDIKKLIGTISDLVSKR